MATLIVAPCPKKPSALRTYTNYYDQAFDFTSDDVQDACQELRQILAHSRPQQPTTPTVVAAPTPLTATPLPAQPHYYYSNTMSAPRSFIRPLEHPIVRTGNPLPQDSSFIPLHQAVSHLQVSDCPPGVKHRPRSYSVGDHRNQQFLQTPINLVH
ncbi:hypothetical protein PHYBLDRAFT_164832 [Phycomyces blakesleeanus NRRL 1555(-)]|uniref:Uncharacterized protein n=1 Tax=Phycomyces blakesleeanus (strain ATCC 8743b / DSM 1359 / FGSC 10004 / NBRC 33097 / NRRL 1555) TaxID=763407 RepID=A0A162UTY1_PHYB8|nr:hypothetical protein PHYBLDRAFT_164832 [Phycomyces blakesleeanus NRRL 1555(-)]OAD77953.1 hypothetical protein PHYBLDRAFT_164832 [Phycomyces blakesleeanus NRRL 1555(-)]|eukprot:XP_018295993.1 hypothetical protein PHYBLDRAFT_164832 [Phycomyces blakesleeanus NRRL 1555(-)]